MLWSAEMSQSFIPLGKRFHAIVSVIAVKIQFSSPMGVLRSLTVPGILQRKERVHVWRHFQHIPPTYWSTESKVDLLTKRPTFFQVIHLSDVWMGVVKQEVKRSAGSWGFIGSISSVPQEARMMLWLRSPRLLALEDPLTSLEFSQASRLSERRESSDRK